jgi:tetratricopeptide (TPR) repeat protein
MAKRRRPSPAKHEAGNRATPMVDVPSAQVRAARGLWNKGQRADALRLFDDAIRREPNNVRTYVMAARAYAEKYDFIHMEEVFEKLVQRAPRHPGVHHYIGETYGLLKLPDRAIASYERASRLPGAGPTTWIELASLYERAHRLDEAEELIERTMAIDFKAQFAWLVKGRIQRRQGRLDEAEQTFRTLIERSPRDSELACQVWGELALMKDEQGEWDQAIDAIARCKQVQMAHEAFHWNLSETAHERMRQLIATVTRDDLRRWREAAEGFAPCHMALLTGFPRSGTTLLEQVLDAHPDVVSSEERDFIGKELFLTVIGRRVNTPLLELLNELGVPQIEADRKRYFLAMEYILGQPVGGRMHLDKNPAYNLTIPQVLRFFPETRLILALRDPRDVVLSCYLRYLPLNAVAVRFLDIQRTAERYALDMGAWLRLRELVDAPWCEIRYEDTVANLAGQARRALATLGLPWCDDVLNYRQRLLETAKQVTSPTYEAVAQPIYTKAIGRWHNYERLLEPALKTLEPFIREFGYSP